MDTGLVTLPQAILFAILAATVVLFAWGRWRHDVVALAALLACVAAGLVPAAEAFAGFGHPAVITVACVLILSRGLQNSGAVDALARRVLPADAKPLPTIAGMTGLAALLSGFMNNVGALALMMPVALKAAPRLDLPPGRLLMPLAFGSILGGMTTLIGTPPNLIVSGYRRETLGEPFSMFDFTPVGLAIAVVCLIFIALVGWRLVPERRRAGVEGFETGAYITEARVAEESRAVGMTLRQVEDALDGVDVQILGLIRREVRLRAPRSNTKVRAEDILILEAEPEGLANALPTLGISLEAAVPTEEVADDADESAADEDEDEDEDEEDKADGPVETEKPDEGETVLMELVVPPAARLIGRTSDEIHLRMRYHINLLAISRGGQRSIGRLRSTRLAAGDVLLVQGTAETIGEFASDHGCLPLAVRPLSLPSRRQMWTSIGILLAAVALAASGLTPAPVAFAAGVLAAMLTRVVPPREVYDAVDWPVIVLLACLLPVAGAMLDTGAADVLAQLLVVDLAGGRPVVALTLILVVTMTLSDVMNNAATVAVMAPIAYGAALALDVDPDSYFMAVAIGGSCAFLTPIGHQNNTLILGPGGFRFGDYWRLGLPIEILVVVVGVPMILLVWGL